MTLQKVRGFTLIELLVVVLIIGILAAVALPQYNKAVRRARVAAAIALLDSIYPAVQSCYLRTGDMAQCTLENLDIGVDTTCEVLDSSLFFSCRILSGGAPEVLISYGIRPRGDFPYGGDVSIRKDEHGIYCIAGGPGNAASYLPFCEKTLGFTKECTTRTGRWDRCM